MEKVELEQVLQEYIRLMVLGDYFDAHEVLESAWHPMRRRCDPLANLLKGLINGAVSFEHLKRKKKGARSRARRVMASYERHKHLWTEGIPYYPLFLQACRLVEEGKLVQSDVFLEVPYILNR